MVEWSSRPALAVAIVACLVLGSLGLVAGISTLVRPAPDEPWASGSVGSQGPTLPKVGSASTPMSSAPTGHNANALPVERHTSPRENPTARAHLPDSRRAAPNQPGPIQPFYTQAPAPMGVADIGIRNESGVLVPYELNTTSVAGTVNITNLQSIYVDGDGPDTYGIQLNSVVAGVTIFGNSSYEFWAQNYAIYTIGTRQLTFGDEVWNNSNPAGTFPQNSIYAGSNGTFLAFPPPAIWQGYGPTVTVGYPFTLTLYSNTTVIADRPALYFNYTLSNGTSRLSASYDDLIFNSTVGTPTQAAPIPYYQADGYQYDPAGATNDMEIDILGNDNGDTTCFTAADATISLQYWNATAGRMEEVPSAFNAGQETGETSTGLAVYSSGGPNPVAIVRPGPSFVGGLWNYSGQSGAVADTVTVHPVGEYSFLFINTGSSVNPSQAQWVPTSTTGAGTTTFYLPAGGTYSLEYMMNEYDPFIQVVTASGSVTLPSVRLTYDPTVGIYTPLFAFTNGELASISSAGAGTVGNPYVLINNQYGSLAPQFATWNDWEFPQFPGLLIAGTTAYVQITPPSFEINLPSWDFAAPSAASLGLPLTNNLQLQFYDASNIELVRAAGVLGWFASALSTMAESSVMFWNCTDSLVLSNTFDDQGAALLFYGGTNNVVWGNTFVTTPIVAVNPLSVDGAGGWDTGINESESGDLVYNNQFEVGIPAITVTYDLFECLQFGTCPLVTYNDTWNVTMQPASNYTIVDGWNLTGSIIGTWYQGGNYWSNYGTGLNLYGSLPYDNTGDITVGGDYVPLIPFSIYPVTFRENGLSGGLGWGVILPDGTWVSTNEPNTLLVWFANGTYNLSLYTPSPYFVPGSSVLFVVAGAPLTVDVDYTEYGFISAEEQGLPQGLQWSVTVSGPNASNVITQGPNVTAAPYSFLFLAPPGDYDVSAQAAGYDVSPTSQPVSVSSGSDSIASFDFTALPGTLDVQVTPATAQVWIDGSLETLNASGGLSLPLPVGFASVTVLAPGYQPYFTNITIVSNFTMHVYVSLTPIPLGKLTVTVSPTSATLYFDSVKETLTSGSFSIGYLPAGVYSIVVSDSGYYTYYNNVSIKGGASASLSVALDPISSGSTSSGSTAGISTTGWIIIAAVAALAVAFLVGMIYFARRPPQRPGPRVAAPLPAQPWQETPPDQPPPSD